MVHMPGQSQLPPFQHRFLQTSDLRLHYAELETDGKPLVLLHGIGMDWRVWQAISRRLAPGTHLYMVDLRGHGESDKPSHGYSLAHYAADIEDFFDRLGLVDAAIIGSSLGGMVAVAMEVPPDVLRHRVLVDPPLTGGPIRDRVMFEEIQRLKHGPVEALTDYLSAWNPGAGRFLMRMMAEMWHATADGVLDDALAHADHFFDVDPALRADESPTLLLRADPSRGGVLTESDADRALALLPHGTCVYIAGSGHAIHATNPVEFAAVVRSFLGCADDAGPQ